jgi:hypothetical protein
VFLAEEAETWVARDIAAELRILFPEVNIWCRGEKSQSDCDLAIIPFFEDDKSYQRPAAIQEALAFSPVWIGFYELRRRRLVVVRRSGLAAHRRRAKMVFIGRALLYRFERLVPGGSTLIRRVFNSTEFSP